MKKATFIAVVTTVVVILAGCGSETSSQSQESVEQQNSDVNIERLVTMEVYEEDMQKKDNEIAYLKGKIKDLEEANSKTQEESETTETVETSAMVEATEAVKVPLIPKNQENIRVSALYHGKEIPLYVATEENRADAINNAKSIAVQDARGNDIRDRDISFIINGVSVTNVYVVDDGFKEVEDLSYDGVDNTYLAQYYMPGAGQYTFLIRTSNGTHYYTTVEY